MRIAHHGLVAQCDEAPSGQRPQRLVIEGGLSQELRRAYRVFQLRNRLQEFGLPRRSAPQFFEFGLGDVARGLHEQLFLPADFSAPDHLRKQTAHDCFNRTAIVGTHPPGYFEQLLAQNRCIADDCFDWPDAVGFALLGDGDNCCQSRLIPERHAHARADSDATG